MQGIKRTKLDLQQKQGLPLSIKLIMTQQRIREWVREYGIDGVYVSFSGGKDSTVLLHIVRQMYPEIEAVFVNTGLEYPEIQKFVKTFENVTILRPKMRFDEVIKKYGYPLISKEQSAFIQEYRSTKSEKLKDIRINGNRWGKGKISKRYLPLIDASFNVSDKCCDIMKKSPAKEYEKKTGKKPIVATMAHESFQRQSNWIMYGCNAFEKKRPTSQPMSFWTEQDVLQYIKAHDLPIASVYGSVEYEKDPEQLRWGEIDAEFAALDSDEQKKLTTTGCERTGCIFCAFGCHMEKGKSRFERLKETHPRQYEYCIGGGEYVDGVWQPNKQGLGMGHVFDELNNLYGEDFIRY